MGCHCVCCDHHALQKLVWISFHDTAIHKCSRISLVSITDNVPDFFRLSGYLLPFSSCRKSAAASSTQSGTVYFVYHLLRCHIKQCF